MYHKSGRRIHARCQERLDQRTVALFQTSQKAVTPLCDQCAKIVIAKEISNFRNTLVAPVVHDLTKNAIKRNTHQLTGFRINFDNLYSIR